MSSRKNRASLMKTVFSDVNPYQTHTTEEQPNATRINTYSILPDPHQPRRLLSIDLYTALFQGQKKADKVLQEWLAQGRDAHAPKSLLQDIAELRQTADTIEYGDLIQPITVRPVTPNDRVPAGVEYLIVVGERRWWSHVLLAVENRLIQQTLPPTEIKVQVVQEITSNILALQLIENIARADLSVIEKAWGLQKLQEEMSAELGKKVKWQEIEKMLGLDRTYRFRITNVLKLSPEAQGLVMAHRLQEGLIRPIVEKLEAYPELQLQTLQQLVQWLNTEEENISQKLRDYIDRLLQPKSSPKQKTAVHITELVDKLGKNVTGALKIIRQLNREEVQQLTLVVSQNDVAKQQLADLRDQLNHILDQTE